jgi:hypothetical protein
MAVKITEYFDVNMLRTFFYIFTITCSLKNMEKNERAIEVLNDLIRINNDRIEGYEKAIDKQMKLT